MLTTYQEKTTLLEHWNEAELVQFGDFTLKSGKKSGVYFNFRKLWTNPSVFKDTTQAISAFIQSKNIIDEQTIIIPLPYAGIPLAACIAVILDKPHILFRKEPKNYGTHKTPSYLESPIFLESILKNKTINIIFIDDVLTTGATFIESFPAVKTEFKAHGFELNKISLITLMSRSNDSIEKINKIFPEVQLFPFTDTAEILGHLYKKKSFNDIQLKHFTDEFQDFANSKNDALVSKQIQRKINKGTANKTVDKVLNTIVEKKTNICLSWDNERLQPLLTILPFIADSVLAIKLHYDIYNDKKIMNVLEQIKALCTEHKIFIIEDRKLSDIGSTAKKQITNFWEGNFEWIDFVTVHPISGPGILEVFKTLKNEHKNVPSPIIVEKMSSSGNLCDENYVSNTRKFSASYTDILGGFVTQQPDISNNVINFTPGVHFDTSSDDKDQRYHSPTFATFALKTDVLIMGRGLMFPPKSNENTNWNIIPTEEEELKNYSKDMQKHIQTILKQIF